VLFFFHIRDVKILVDFAPKIVKLVKIRLEKQIFQNFPDCFLVEKQENFRLKKKHWTHYNGESNVNQQTIEYNIKNKTCADNL
jgi:hypothetical protein